MKRIRLPKPTSEEIGAILSPQSADTELVDIAKPTYDYIRGKLGSDAAVSEYISNRITSELVRVSKLKGRIEKLTHEERIKNGKVNGRKGGEARAELFRSGKLQKRETIRLFVFEEQKKLYNGLSANKQDRAIETGRIIDSWIGRIDESEMKAYSLANPDLPKCSITIPKAQANAAKIVGKKCDVPFSKVVCYILWKEGRKRL